MTFTQRLTPSVVWCRVRRRWANIADLAHHNDDVQVFHAANMGDLFIMAQITSDRDKHGRSSNIMARITSDCAVQIGEGDERPEDVEVEMQEVC